jgi:hypothetical protein
MDPLLKLWPALLSGGDLASLFVDQPILDVPHPGRVMGRRGLAEYAQNTREWLRRQKAQYEQVAVVRLGAREVHEGLLHLTRESGDLVHLPLAMSAELSDDKVSWLRIYHSQWPLRGKHEVRPPLLTRADVAVSDVVGEYQRALAAGDLEGILATFAEDGYAREPAGEPYVYRGSAGLRQFYAALFANDGGIPLEHCAVLDDGVCCAVEYNAIRWGRTPLTPQAGIAVYERNGRGKLAAARIYDDVDPPL